MKAISAKEFQTKVGKVKDLAMEGPIGITSHGRLTHVLLSFHEYQKITGNGRRSISVTQLSDEELNAIDINNYPKEFEHLDD